MKINIKLIMNRDKSIDIMREGKLKHKIKEEKREISAQEIYNIFNYAKGDLYCIETQNSEQKDEPVLKYFYELFENINNKISGLSEDEK